MNTLRELNLAMSSHLIPGRDKAKQDYIANMRSAVAYMQPSADKIESFFTQSAHAHSNQIQVVYANRDFLNGIRLAAKDVFAGRVQNLVIFDLDIRLAQILAKLTNQQINQLAIHWPGNIYVAKAEQIDTGKELHPDVANFHAISLGRFTAADRVTKTLATPHPIGTDAIRDKASPVIPEHARIEDPIWRTSLLTLAEDLVMAGTKPKIIERYTGVKHSLVTEMYRTLMKREAPSGPPRQGNSSLYVSVRRISYPHVIQNAVFANIYQRLKKLVLVPANRGWLLVHAFRAYKEMVLMEDEGSSISLDINSAFAMVTCIGIESDEASGDLALSICPDCGVRYLVLTASDHADQKCPICSYENYLHRLQNGVSRPDRAIRAA